MKIGTKSLVVRKTTAIRMSPELLESQLRKAATRAIGKTLAARGWAFRKPKLETSEAGGRYLTTATMKFARTALREFTQENLDKQFVAIETRFLRKAGRLSWNGEAVTVSLRVRESGEPSGNGDTPVPPAGKRFAGAPAITVPDNWPEYFSHIFDREDHIQEVMDSIRTAKETDMEVRNHVCLFGPPGCGKTEIGLAVRNMLGPRAVKRLDATSTTKAGAENLLLDEDELQPILIMEEAEKCHEGNLSWLLGILDDRGEIIKTNARVGSVCRKAPMLVVVTVNNMKKWEAFQEGALADRFSIPVYCPMPDRDLLRKILLRDVVKIPGGNAAWVEPALDFALDVEKTYKTRRIRAIMTNGRDQLLDGSYQAARLRMMETRRTDRAKLADFGITDV